MNFTTVLISAHLPGHDPVNLGVLVLDETANRIHLRFRTDFDDIAESPDLEVIRGLPAMIESMAEEMGAMGVLRCLEDRASNAIRLGDRVTFCADNASEAAEREFGNHVA
jgi:hypothetical protein